MVKEIDSHEQMIDNRNSSGIAILNAPNIHSSTKGINLDSIVIKKKIVKKKHAHKKSKKKKKTKKKRNKSKRKRKEIENEDSNQMECLSIKQPEHKRKKNMESHGSIEVDNCSEQKEDMKNIKYSEWDEA